MGKGHGKGPRIIEHHHYEHYDPVPRESYFRRHPIRSVVIGAALLVVASVGLRDCGHSGQSAPPAPPGVTQPLGRPWPPPPPTTIPNTPPRVDLSVFPQYFPKATTSGPEATVSLQIRGQNADSNLATNPLIEVVGSDGQPKYISDIAGDNGSRPKADGLGVTLDKLAAGATFTVNVDVPASEIGGSPFTIRLTANAGQQVNQSATPRIVCASAVNCGIDR